MIDEDELISLMFEQDIEREEKRQEAEEIMRCNYNKLREITGFKDENRLNFMACFLHELKGTEEDSPFHSLELYEIHKKIYTKYENYIPLREVSALISALKEANLIEDTRKESYWIKYDVTKEKEARAEKEIKLLEEGIRNYTSGREKDNFTQEDFLKFKNMIESKKRKEEKLKEHYTKKKYDETIYTFITYNLLENKFGEVVNLPEDFEETEYKKIKKKTKYLKLSNNEQTEEVLQVCELIAEGLKK